MIFLYFVQKYVFSLYVPIFLVQKIIIQYMSQKIKMKFVCDENWDEMTPTQSGRYCNVCEKNVEDFTKFPLHVVQEKTKHNIEKKCGSFKIEHIDPSIIRPIETPKYLKYVTFVSTLLLTVSSNHAYAQLRKNVKIERVETRLTELKPEKIAQTKVETDTLEVKQAVERPFKRKERYYLSSKFPFIIKRRSVILGRYF
jgi:hypothetical protein